MTVRLVEDALLEKVRAVEVQAEKVLPEKVPTKKAPPGKVSPRKVQMSDSPESIVTPGDAVYPELLGQIAAPPEKLYVKGTIERQDTLAVAMVGSRQPTPYGRHMARRIAGDLAQAGVTVISGLARGIDTEAHLAALRKGGRTIAVLGCGLDVDYPRGAGDLKKKICSNPQIYIYPEALISHYLYKHILQQLQLPGPHPH